MKDLRSLPKLRDSLSYVYVEKALVQRFRQSVEVMDQEGRVALPIASLSVLMLGPGTRITHEAVKLLARSGCSIVWVGEDGVKYYAQGTGETRKAYRLLHQAKLVSEPHLHRQVAVNMYHFRFDTPLPDNLTIQQLRGHEGARVRDNYAFMSQRYGVPWTGRRYTRDNWHEADAINRALSAANSLLNGICHAAIVSGGFSPGLGFIHTGKQLSFVYDVADLYKAEITVPVAFETVALGEKELGKRVRQAMRRKIKEKKLLQRILPDLDSLLMVGKELEQDDILDEDEALPTDWWGDDERFEDGES